MKKKNFLWSMFAIMMVTMLSVSLSACGSDDDDDNGGSSVVGTWKGNSDGESLTLTFKNDGTGTYVIVWDDSWTGEGEVSERGTFSYSMSSSHSGYLTIRYEDSYSGISTDTYDFEVDGRRMYLTDRYGDSAVLTKQ